MVGELAVFGQMWCGSKGANKFDAASDWSVKYDPNMTRPRPSPRPVTEGGKYVTSRRCAEAGKET